jgi:hypothetical protein
MLTELKLQFSTGNAEIALDVLVSFICAPDPSAGGSLFASSSQHNEEKSSKTKLTLRAALRLELEETAPTIVVSDPLSVELIIRLSRRVEAFAASSASASALGMLHIVGVDPHHHDGNTGNPGAGLGGEGGDTGVGVDVDVDMGVGVVDMEDVDGDVLAAALSAAGVGVGLGEEEVGGMGMDLG